MKILERLARVETADIAPFNSWLQTHTIPLGWGGTALVVTPTADSALCQTLHHWVKRGINPVLIQVERSSKFPQIKERSRRLGFTAVQVLSPAELEKALGEG